MFHRHSHGGFGCKLGDVSPRKILLLDGDLLVKRPLGPLLRLEPVSAGKDKVRGGRVLCHDASYLYHMSRCVCIDYVIHGDRMGK